MPPANASVIVRSVVVTPAGGAPTMYMELEIDCAVCGPTRGIVFGHHLRTLYKAIGMIIEANPALCGDEGNVQETLTFGGTHTPGTESVN